MKSYEQILAVLKVRWRVVATICAMMTVTTLATSLLLPKKYTASASVVIDVKSPDPIAGMVLPGLMSPAYMATQQDILLSERVALRVISALNLDKVESLRDDWIKSTQGAGDFNVWIARSIKEQLDVKPSRESNVITVAYTGGDPKFAAAVANEFVQAYIETNVELRSEPAKQFSALFDAQGKQARERFESAQAALSQYQRDNGILDNDQRMDAESTRLNQLMAQLAATQSVAEEARSRATLAADNSQEVLNSQLINNLKAELSRNEARQKELDAKFGANHPEVMQITASIMELRSRISAETARVRSGISQNRGVTSSHEAGLLQEIELQRKKLMELKAKRDSATLLERDVENARRAYDAMMQRYSQSNLESSTSQSNVSVLQRATPPADASSPKVLLNIAMAIVIGLILGSVTAILLEQGSRRVLVAQDLLEIGAPMFGAIPHAQFANAAPKKMLSLPRNKAPENTLLPHKP